MFSCENRIHGHWSASMIDSQMMRRKSILLTLVGEMVPPSCLCPVQPTKLLLNRLRPENRLNLELYLSSCYHQLFWVLLENRKIPIGEKCHSQKVYGIFPFWPFVLENCCIIFIPTKFGHAIEQSI